MELEPIIERFALTPSDEWKALALRVSWYYRTSGQQHFPPKVLAAFGGEPPERSVWDDIRKRVAAKRRAMKYSERKYQLDQQRLRRRAYMRTYMKQFRVRQKQPNGEKKITN